MVNSKKLKTILEQYGLKERHAIIYLAVLELGSASVQKVSQKSGFARSTCDAVLFSLRQKGLVTSFKKKKTSYFSPEDPNKVVQIAKEKADMLEKALPSFNNLYNKANILPTVRVYEGVENIKLILREILNEADRLIGFGSVDDIYKVIGEYFPWFTKERIRRKIPLRIILRDSELARIRQKVGHQELREVRIIPESYDCTSVTFIWQNKITMFSLQEDTIALIIESRELANIQRAMFELIWQTLPKN